MDPNGETDAGARVRAARRRCGLSLRGLASRLGISPATLSQLENGRTGITLARLSAIAAALGTTVQDLLVAPLPADRDGDPDPAGVGPPGERAVRPGVEAGDWRAYPPLGFDPVLAAALQEFLRAGYHGTSVRDIARCCGLSVSGLYHHYVSKQEMLREILDHTMSDLLRRSREARAEGAGPVERFALLVECLALFHTHRRDLGFVGASEMRSLEPANRECIADLRNAQQRMVDEQVETAVERGLFRNRYPHEASRAVVTMCTALPQWFRPGGPLTPEQIAERYVEFALDLMRSGPSRTTRV